eukprot:TRINITY_DN3553_c0_g1_i14.p1 TRINITY_DN3553_c0_g1~~TRINITY_DN3553_c0_g1_i14.p1  ORF type:complete len:223 (+),score=51.17 TRINITY_DN3553_c0_g1_i14:62-670(+)
MSDPFPSVYQQNCCSLSFFSERLINCPECGKAILDVTTHSSELSNHVVPGCMVVKPTFGSFLNYSCDSLLHTGISDSKGNVFNFDSRGICIDAPERWSPSLSIRLSCTTISDLEWDRLLLLHVEEEREREKKRRYHQINNNCYDFVMRFLNFINYENRKNHEKEQIVVSLIAPLMDKFESFYKIHEEIRKNGIAKRFTATQF